MNNKTKQVAEQPAQYDTGIYGPFGSKAPPAPPRPKTEQPAQQEPVAWLRKSDLAELRTCNYMRLGADSPSIWAPNAPDEPSPDMELVAVYTSPPAQRKPLTDEEIDNAMRAADTKWADAYIPIHWARHFARAIEAAHGIQG